jgi:Ca2+-binding EF-hand superfamily protein
MNNLTSEQITTIQNIFNTFDSNNDGLINRRELYSLTIALNDPLTPAELADFFKSIDTDNSGSITWDEFITYWGNQ